MHMNLPEANYRRIEEHVNRERALEFYRTGRLWTCRNTEHVVDFLYVQKNLVELEGRESVFKEIEWFWTAYTSLLAEYTRLKQLYEPYGLPKHLRES